MNVIDFKFFAFNVSIWVPWSPFGPKKLWYMVELFRFTRYVERNKVHFAPFLRFHWNHHNYSVSPTFLTSGRLVDKQQKKGEDIKISLDTQLNFMFSKCSQVFCCISARGLEVSLHFWRSWPTVCRLRKCVRCACGRSPRIIQFDCLLKNLLKCAYQAYARPL